MERLGRSLVISALAISALSGFGFGLLNNNSRRLADTDSITAATPGANTFNADTFNTAFFVRPQPQQKTPYGTQNRQVKRGVASQIEPTVPLRQFCDLETSAVTRTVTVSDLAGQPVSGAYVLFTVTRGSTAPSGETAETQLVGDVTDANGLATLSVLVPKRALGETGALPSYSVMATMETETGQRATHFTINTFNCSSEVVG